MSALENHFALLLKAHGIDKEFVREHKFHATRKWRFDWACPLHRVAIELDGGAWIQGRHTRGAGFLKDAEKGNAAVVLGWRVLHYTSKADMARFYDDYCKLIGAKI